MTEWKEVLINDYFTIDAVIAEHEKALRDDKKLNTLKKQRDKIEDEILEHSRTLTNLIHEAEMKRISIKEQLTKKWDIEDKTFKCDTGSATLRTTKSLIVTDKMALVGRLAEILNNEQKAFDCIRSFDLSTIRKYMDVDLIAGYIAHYDKKQSVVIKGGDR
jgi:hypothetical protein